MAVNFRINTQVFSSPSGEVHMEIVSEGAPSLKTKAIVVSGATDPFQTEMFSLYGEISNVFCFSFYPESGSCSVLPVYFDGNGEVIFSADILEVAGFFIPYSGFPFMSLNFLSITGELTLYRFG